MNSMRLLVLVPIVIVLGCGKTTSRFDSRTQAILRGSTRVEVFRTDGKYDPEEGKPLPEGVQFIGNFPVIARGANQGQPFADKLAAVLLDDQTYTNTYAACFWPGVAYRVWKADEYVDVLICFFCHNLYCGPPNKAAIENGSFAGSPAESKLVRLAKEAFPNDEEIQALKD